MAKAKKLPSGKWRVQTSVSSEILPNGEKIYHKKSFTADTKKDAEYMAANFVYKKCIIQNTDLVDMTFKVARNRYITDKENILSVSTIRGYKQMSTYFMLIDNMPLKEIAAETIQVWANSFSKNHSPKTVKNASGFVRSVLKTYNPTLHLNTTLPQRIRPKLYVPNDGDIKKIIQHYITTDMDMLRAVYLAAFATLRRSEICALTAEDINKNILHVHSAMVIDENKKWVIKTTKTVSSDRFIPIPDFVVQAMPTTGYLILISPDNITNRFGRTLKKLNITKFRFHDLRHYSASIMHAIGIPDQYIMERGGWSTDGTLKDVYRGSMDDYSTKYSNQANNYFDKLNFETSTNFPTDFPTNN